MEKHEIFGGAIKVYRRPRSKYWQCAARLDGFSHRISTKEHSLAKAKDFAEDWYLRLRLRHKEGRARRGKTFKEAAAQFWREYELMTEGQRSPIYTKRHEGRLRVHLLPFFGNMYLTEITASRIQDYRMLRVSAAKKPAHSTLHQEIVTLRQVLKCAIRHGWLDHLPDMSTPYRKSNKVTRRSWFSPDEYRQLYTATRRRAQKPLKKRFKWECEQLHDMVLFMANTGLRPDEAFRLQYRDVEIVEDEATRETILEIEVRGKRGVGFCKSMPSAVRPYERLLERNNPERDDLLFPKYQGHLFDRILKEEDLKFDREGNRRTLYSLRHTYICFRLMEGADIYHVAKNCRTSVEMIEKYYASHIKNMLDASAINVRRKQMKKIHREEQED